MECIYYSYVLLSLLLLQKHTSAQSLISARDNFKLIYQWKQIEYKFSSEQERSEAIANGTFNVGKLQSIDAQYTYAPHTRRERIFITTPRQTSVGYPATLGFITGEYRDGNPIIDPYPSWSWQLNPEKCNYHRMVSVFRTWADECNRLWVMDLGLIEDTFICPPQLLAFDLNTDKLLHRYEIPYNQYQNISYLITVVAEVVRSCENTWVYVADPVGYTLLVYNLKQNISWVIKDKSFEPDPKYYNYTVAGDSFTLPDGILALALTPVSDGLEKRKLRYHAMSSDKESWVYTKHLKNPNNFLVPYGSPQLFYTYKNRRNQQAAAEAVDRRGYVYFSLLIDIEVVRWWPGYPYKREYFEVLANNPETFQFPTGMNIAQCRTTGYDVLWVFTTAYQRFAAGTLNGNETNFRLFTMTL